MTRDDICEREAEVLRAARSSNQDASILRHLDSCPSCREAVRVLAALNSLAELSDETPCVPDPRLLWLKASFARRQQKSQLVSRVAAISYGILAAILGVGVYWFASTDASDLGRQTQAVLPQGDLTSPLLIAVFLLLALAFVFSPSGRHSAS